MVRQVVTSTDLGSGLKIENKKVVVDVAALNIPVDVKLQGVSLDREAKKLIFTLNDNTVIEQDVTEFLTLDTDTKVTAVNVENGEVVITLSDGTLVKGNIVEALRGEEIQDLAGNTLGFLMKA